MKEVHHTRTIDNSNYDTRIRSTVRKNYNVGGRQFFVYVPLQPARASVGIANPSITTVVKIAGQQAPSREHQACSYRKPPERLRRRRQYGGMESADNYRYYEGGRSVTTVSDRPSRFRHASRHAPGRAAHRTTLPPSPTSNFNKRHSLRNTLRHTIHSGDNRLRCTVVDGRRFYTAR